MIASFFSGVHAFFSSAAWTTLQISFLVALALLWVASIRWVRLDARSRIADRLHIRLATVLGAIPPFFGPLIYLLFRPGNTLADVREHELEARAIEARLGTLALACPECRTPVKSEFLVCPSCAARLKDACRSCGKPLDNNWNVCPYCEAPAPGLEIETLDGGAVTDRRAEDRETR